MEHKRVGIDVSAALGEAGHEVEDLGYEDTPDAGPLVTRGAPGEEALRADVDAFAAGFPVDDTRVPRSDALGSGSHDGEAASFTRCRARKSSRASMSSCASRIGRDATLDSVKYTTHIGTT